LLIVLNPVKLIFVSSSTVCFALLCLRRCMLLTNYYIQPGIFVYFPEADAPTATKRIEITTGSKPTLAAVPTPCLASLSPRDASRPASARRENA
jgi:hypothetical protein